MSSVLNSLKITLRVLRVDRRTRVSAILTVAGVAVAIGLVLLLVSLPFATQARAQRALWQERTYAADGPVESAKLLFLSTSDYVDGQKITRIDIAALGDPSTVDLPAGIEKLPAPGQVVVSPELGQIIHRLPASQLADRFGGSPTGALGSAALQYPEQLVVLIGHNAAEMPESAVPLSGFPRGEAQVDPLLQLLSEVGIVVLLVPSLVLVASSSRLTAARRERRLAALRLAGATPGQVIGMVATETTVSAVAGALLGIAVSPLLRGLATFVPWDGGAWLSSDFALPVGLTVMIACVVPVLVVLAAVFGLRTVLSEPLVASGGHTRKPLRWWRLLSLPIAGLIFFGAIFLVDETDSSLLILCGLFLLVGSAVLIGPWLTYAVGGSFIRRWRRPSGLLAGRRLRDDPRGAYRASAGVVLAVFAGSMALTLLPSFESLSGDERPFRESVLFVNTTQEKATALAAQANSALANYGQSVRAIETPWITLSLKDGRSQQALVLDCAAAMSLTRLTLTGFCDGKPGVYGHYAINLNRVTVNGQGKVPGLPLSKAASMHILPIADPDLTGSIIVDPSVLPPGVSYETVAVAVPTTEVNREVVRTAMVRAAGGESVQSRELRLDGQQIQLADLRRVTVIGLLAAAILAGCSAAVATAGSIMDRRRTFGALMAAGTPVKVLSRALRMEAALPAIVATVGAGLVGIAVGLGLFSLMDKGSVVLSPWLMAPVILGFGVAVLAGSVCTPALKRVQAEPLSDE